MLHLDANMQFVGGVQSGFSLNKINDHFKCCLVVRHRRAMLKCNDYNFQWTMRGRETEQIPYLNRATTHKANRPAVGVSPEGPKIFERCKAFAP